MSKLKKELLMQVDDSRAVRQSYIFENIRVSVITDFLLRVEVDDTRTFEDAPTQSILHRGIGHPHFDIIEGNKYFDVVTDKVTFRISKRKKRVVAITLSSGEVVKNFTHGNLKGTIRTLDGTFGAVPLDDGIISRSGVAVFDDSNSLIFDEYGMIAERPHSESDLYYFAYGHNYRLALRDLYRVSGESPLIPRYALGNWWSRYRAYSDKEYKKLIMRFGEKKIPFSVATLDMDWHIVNGIPSKYGGMNVGWTGYTWNEELFPDYKSFLAWLHERDLKVVLNLHPASGVRAYEQMYMEMALELGVDYRNEETVEFDITNPEFVNAYFKVLHHPYEKDGVDFWWIDWQQGTKTDIPHLDPLFLLNHYHYLDSGRDNKRPLIMSRYAGLGSQRYPIGFSGDTVMNWHSLSFQPYFTATASNVGFSWWSHDIGGHFLGIKDDELYVRWVQFGVFSPIFRLHSTNNDLMGKEPWNYTLSTERIATRFMRIRHKLIPYIYTMNYRNHKEGIPLIEPMYYTHPEDDDAYSVQNEYMFGSELLVAPITSKIDKKTGTASTKVYLPEGRWTDIFTNMSYKGGGIVEMNRGLECIPVLAREGAIIPLAADIGTSNSVGLPDLIELKVYRGTNEFELYEDDGETRDYEHGAYIKRKFVINESRDRLTFNIQAEEGDESMRRNRRFRISFMDIEGYIRAEIRLNDSIIATSVASDDGHLVCEIELCSQDRLAVKFIGATHCTNGDLKSRLVNLFSRYQGNNVHKSIMYKAFMAIKGNSDAKRIVTSNIGSVSNKRLRSQIRELLAMEFDED